MMSDIGLRNIDMIQYKAHHEYVKAFLDASVYWFKCGKAMRNICMVQKIHKTCSADHMDHVLNIIYFWKVVRCFWMRL